ncbi:hypothetical protein ACHMW5_04235 [Azospirillum melinis]|uniref:hypothetical protein n=1 Tax=Azospirillum melinis TaxID=328839 RepID=UPI003756C157
MKSRRYTSVLPFSNRTARRALAHKTRAANDNRRRNYITLVIRSGGFSVAYTMSHDEMRRIAASFDADLSWLPTDADPMNLACTTVLCVRRRFGADTVETREHCRRVAAWLGVHVPLDPSLDSGEIEGCTYLIEEMGDGKDARVALAAFAMPRTDTADGTGHRAG